jgi:putative transposase
LFASELSADLLQAVRESTNGGFVLGNDRFAQQIAAMLGRRTWKGSPGRPRKREDEGKQAKQGELSV